MILNNFWKWLKAVATNEAIKGSTLTIDAGFINMSGTAVSVLIGGSTSNSTVINEARLLNNVSLVFGTGTNNYVSTDYSLVNDVTSAFTNLTTAYESAASNEFSQIITTSGLNNSGNVVTITEVGVKKPFHVSSATADNMLLAVIPLAEPITVQPNDTFKVTVEWTQV